MQPDDRERRRGRTGAKRRLSASAAAAGASLRRVRRDAVDRSAGSVWSPAPSADCFARTCAPRRSTRSSSASASTRRPSSRTRGTSRIRPTPSSTTRRSRGPGDDDEARVVSRGPRRAVPPAPSTLWPVRAVRRPGRAGQRLRGDARLLRHLCRHRRRHRARADGREDDEGSGGAVHQARRRAARARTDDRVRGGRRDDRARSRRSGGAAAAREPGGRHAGARQRPQRCRGRTLPPRQCRAVLREPRGVRRSAAAADDQQPPARPAGRERAQLRPPEFPLGRGARPVRSAGRSSARPK